MDPSTADDPELGICPAIVESWIAQAKRLRYLRRRYLAEERAAKPARGVRRRAKN